MSRLPPSPDLEWTDDGAPRSRAVDDVYFSRAGGLEETRAVFLAGCGLPEAWRARRRFAIGELGFGTGLNALATWAAWRRTRASGAVLHYVSVEAAPLDRADAARALAPFDEIAPLAQRLLDRWPARVRGPQRLWFDDDGFALTVIHADAGEALAGLEGRFDAWFLDGFAPARNPDMWSAALIARIAALSAPGARLATYSVAGAVRRALAEAGFAADKQPGFAGKRERLEARLVAPVAAALDAPESVLVIGAGIAGASVAHALHRRGVAVTVVDGADAPGAAASGNPAALLSPRLDRDDGGPARLHRAAWLHALDHYRALGAFTATGLLRRGIDAAVLEDLLADPPLPDTMMRAAGDGLLFPDGGIVDPRAAIAAMLDGIDLRLGVSVDDIVRTGDGWSAAGVAATHVVVAAGAQIGAFATWAPVEFSRGQLEWGQGAAPAHALEDGAYAAPFADGVIFGATFDRLATAAPVAPDEASRVRNLAALARLAPDLAPAALQSRAAIRAATPDRAPLVGPAPDAARFAADAGACLDGLWLFGGFGSRGFSLAPLLAEHAADTLCGAPGMLDAKMRAAVDPARFLARALRRGRPVPA